MVHALRDKEVEMIVFVPFSLRRFRQIHLNS
jgi:hypothetical protein